MATCNAGAKMPSRLVALASVVFAASLGGCGQDVKIEAPQIRPVRTVTIAKHEAGIPITLTGRIEAEDEVALAFRISGRVLEGDLKVGDRLQPGQLVARLESQNELNALRAAQANRAAAQGQLTQARNHFERQDTLLQQGWTTRANHEQAKQGLQTAQAQVDATEAQLKTAHDLVSFTEIKADAPALLLSSAQELVKSCRPGR
jgi:RND family efflux transporter MFP subunit